MTAFAELDAHNPFFWAARNTPGGTAVDGAGPRSHSSRPNIESFMAAYASLAFLSFLWGSSFFLIKIAARVFDPFGFALARVGVAAGALLVGAALAGPIWPGRRLGLWSKLVVLSLAGQVVPFLLLGKAEKLASSADMALIMGASPIFVFLVGRFVGPGDRWSLRGALGLALGFARVSLALLSPVGQTAAAPNPVEGGRSRSQPPSVTQ